MTAQPIRLEQTSAAVWTLDELAEKTVAELEALYRGARIPTSLRALSGTPTSRMLAIRGLSAGRMFDAARRFAASGLFPWIGKQFATHSESAGTGINRLRLVGERFSFETSFAPSVIDGAPCILLDYRSADNPRPIRMIRDELREVSPGLFLGPALLDTGRGKPQLMIYFACDFNA